jgi:hypothetical protein
MIWKIFKKKIDWVKTLFKKKHVPINNLSNDKIDKYHNSPYIILRSRIQVTQQMKTIKDVGYVENFIKQQIAKDIADNLVNNKMMEWIEMDEFGENWVEGRIKIIYNG